MHKNFFLIFGSFWWKFGHFEVKNAFLSAKMVFWQPENSKKFSRNAKTPKNDLFKQYQNFRKFQKKCIKVSLRTGGVNPKCITKCIRAGLRMTRDTRIEDYGRAPYKMHFYHQIGLNFGLKLPKNRILILFFNFKWTALITRETTGWPSRSAKMSVMWHARFTPHPCDASRGAILRFPFTTPPCDA